MSSGAQEVTALDFAECAADAAPAGRLRIARKGGQLLVSGDGGEFSLLGAERDMQSIFCISAAEVLPTGFAWWFTDLLRAGDHAVNFSGGSVAPVNSESGGKRRLSTGGATNICEILPDSAANVIPVLINPKTSAWYAEGRAAIETHASTSQIYPVSIALTGVGLVGPPTSDTYVALGLVGSSYTGGLYTGSGNDNFLSFIAVSAGAAYIQTTTIPWSSLIQSYALFYDGAGLITARAFAPDGTVQIWTTRDLNQIPQASGGTGNIGFHGNQWLYCSNAAATTMLCDYVGAAGPRI